MKLSSQLALAGAVSLSLCLPALAQGVAVAETAASAPNIRAASREVVIRARVVELDKADRTATLRGPKGNLVTVDVPASVKNLDQVNVGDDVVIHHLAAVVAKLEPMAKRTGIRERIERTEGAVSAPGQLPGLSEVRTVEVLAVVQSLNAKTRQATLRGARRTVTVDVPSDVNMRDLKVGDEVRAVFTEATVISVERAPTPATPAVKAAPAAAAASKS